MKIYGLFFFNKKQKNEINADSSIFDSLFEDIDDLDSDMLFDEIDNLISKLKSKKALAKKREEEEKKKKEAEERQKA